MIISHKHKFIFIKTKKTAGTSIELYLSQFTGQNDVLTPLYPPVETHTPQNHEGRFNPIPETIAYQGKRISSTMEEFKSRTRFFNHMSAQLVKSRIPSNIWRSYYKFCVERNPWDKTVSHYYMLRARLQNDLSFDQYFERGSFCLNYPLYTDGQGKLMVDKVLKFEHLSEELGMVFNHLGIPFGGQLDIYAKTEYRKNKTSYHEILSTQQKSIIENAFNKEIALHGYVY